MARPRYVIPKRFKRRGSMLSNVSSVSSQGRVGGRSSSRYRVPSTKLTGRSTVAPSSSYVTSTRYKLGTILGDGTGSLANASTINFTLGQLPNAAEFIALFDQFRMKRVSVMFIPRTNTVSDLSSPPVQTNQLVLLTSAVDLNGTPAGTSLSDLLEYGSCEQHLLQGPVTISFEPRTTDLATGVLMPAGSYLGTELGINQQYRSLRYHTDTSALAKDSAVDVFVEVLCEYRQGR